jgi:hypothetical protein
MRARSWLETVEATQRDGSAFRRTRFSRGITDGQECRGVRVCAAAWEGYEELVTTRNCLRMPLWSENTGVPDFRTVQYGSQWPT